MSPRAKPAPKDAPAAAVAVAEPTLVGAETLDKDGQETYEGTDRPASEVKATGPIIVQSAPPEPPGPRAAIRRSATHEYTYEGKTYPGVTGILKVLDKSDVLMNWAARNTAEAALSQLDNLASLRASVGDEGVIKALTSRSAWKRDEAGNLGSTIHEMADLIVRGLPTPAMTPVVHQRVVHYVEWWEASGWKHRLSEAMVVNPELRYGGTFDLLAYDRDGRTVLGDVKSGKGVYIETALQLAGYAMAPLVCPVGSPIAYQMPVPDRYVVLHVTADGVREIEMSVGEAERDAFEACVRLARWNVSMKGKRF